MYIYWSSCTVLLFLLDFNETWIFPADFRKKKTQILNFKKIRPVGAELFRADGRTDMEKLIIAFRDFANAPNNVRWSSLGCSYLHPSVTFQYFPQHHARRHPRSVFFAWFEVNGNETHFLLHSVAGKCWPLWGYQHTCTQRYRRRHCPHTLQPLHDCFCL
jgi:hypothetical protein